jgi:RNA polymerase sigma factor (sigma-70 family)
MDDFTASRQSDAELVSSIKAGSADAFRMLYERFESLVKNYVRKNIWNRNEREDACQHIFLSIFGTITRSDFQLVGDSLLPLLKTITRASCADYGRLIVRTQRLHYSDDVEAILEPDSRSERDNPFEIAAEGDYKAFVLNQLPPKMRQILLFWTEGDSANEIAEKLGVTPRWIRVCFHAILKTFKRLSDQDRR